MTEVHLEDDIRDIDDILSSIRRELGGGEARPQVVARERQLSVVRVEALPQEEEPFSGNRKSVSAQEFESLDEVAFLHAAYRVVLGRDIDESGLDHYLPHLRNDVLTPVDVLRSLSSSPEGRARGVEITDLESRGLMLRLSRIPLVGGIVMRLRRFMLLPQNDRRMHKRIVAGDRRQRELVAGLGASLSSIRRSMQQLEQRLIETEQQTRQAEALAQQTVESRDGALSELAAARQQMVVQARTLSDLIQQARTDNAAPLSPSTAQALEDASLDSLYVAFENRFRGSTAAIGERLKRYVDMFRANAVVASGGTVLDIGCGRGEWLALLRDANIQARGIDLNGAMAAEARGLGLAVEEGDAIAHMRSLASGSLAAVTGFHIVEHLPFRELVAMFDAAHSALSPGGFVLFETPNPENLVVGACTFNLDPTHNRPLPPEFLRFIAEARGFSEVRIIRSDDDCDLESPESGASPSEINDWFRAPADYAIYARKAG